jgi:hypothetical protein
LNGATHGVGDDAPSRGLTGFGQGFGSGQNVFVKV